MMIFERKNIIIHTTNSNCHRINAISSANYDTGDSRAATAIEKIKFQDFLGHFPGLFSA